MNDFMRGVVFELEKETPFQGGREFKFYIKRKYGIIPDAELYRMIINYRVEKYGSAYSLPKHREYIKRFGSRTSKHRIRVREINKDYSDLEKLVNRND